MRALAERRGPNSSTCPSDAARAVAEDWHDLLPEAREAVARFIAREVTPHYPTWERDGGVHRSMGLAMADALASLGTVDYEQAGLTGFGKPDGFLERQVTRWMGELDSFSALAGYEGP